uniref:Methyltransferase type 11 domain-containing protein n=1 Tax=Sus scrofa TaxID=9823 RepID=A0A8D1Z813_PIG
SDQTLCLVILCIWTFWACGTGYAKKWLPYFLARFRVTYNEQIVSKKRELFSNLQEFAGPSGKLSLLELGCGTGTNFKFYPPGCRVACIDPNPNFERFLIKSIAENRHLQFERFVVSTGEDMHQVADGFVDVVVCTLVLCSVKNQDRVLQEVCRVLRPVSVGHALIFVEHIAAECSCWNFSSQQFLSPARPFLLKTCQQSQNVLEGAAFSQPTLQLPHAHWPGSYLLLIPLKGYSLGD